ncbi:MAG: prolipoprotein diacylglyceryl transferase [Candidatus Omnitrophica bacterium]|nr:prolipoprotein diacylglyceryl transferase [Candidatus Omnitrophota bacterium]
MYPEFLRIGTFVIYWYGVMIAAGVFLSSWIFQKNAYRSGYSPELVSKLVFWIIVWGIAGGRFLHVLVQMPYYYRHPVHILSIRNGGLAVEGAVIAALLFIAVYSKIRRFNLNEILDILALSVPLGQALGRVGCFLNGCCYGRPTGMFTGVSFPPFYSEKVHPTQLYYSISYILLFFFLNAVRKRKMKPGFVFCVYLMGFALIRYIVDMLRGDLHYTFLGLYLTQVIAIFIFITGTLWIFKLLKKG